MPCLSSGWNFGHSSGTGFDVNAEFAFFSPSVMLVCGFYLEQRWGYETLFVVVTGRFTLVQSCLWDSRVLHGLQDFYIHLFLSLHSDYWLFCLLLLLCSGAFWLLVLEAEDETLWNYFGCSKVHGAAVLVYLEYWYRPGLVLSCLLGGRKDFDLSTEILNTSFSKHPTLVMAKAVTWYLYIGFLFIKPAFISRLLWCWVVDW